MLTTANRPAEIRLAVFEYLIDDEPTMPKIIKCSKQEKDSALRRLVRRRLYPASYSLLNSLTLVNRQIRDEFLVVFCQKTTFSFTLDASNTENDSFWKLSPRMLSSIRKCKLKLLASPGIVGAFDPRHASGRWVMRDKTILMLGKMQNLVDVQLSIQACGNQLWNPIWLWHYTSQSFKQITMAGFTRISFKLEEEMKMREPNNLANGGTGPWHWRCSAGHRVLADPVGSQPIRQFCGALFADCNICDTQAQAP